MDILLFAIAIYLFDTLTASGTACAAHHTSGSTYIANALYAIQTARPRFHTTIETPTNILIAFGATFFTFVSLWNI
jgi:hypothetical protein